MSDAVLVADVGTASLKAGYAGDNAPLSIIPSIAIKCATGVEVMEPSEYGTDAEHSKSIHPVERGRVKNWDQLENLWKIMMDDIGISSLDSTSVSFE
jgi:actin-related protein